MGDQKKARVFYIGATNRNKVNTVATIFQVEDSLPVDREKVHLLGELNPKEKEKRGVAAAKTKEVCLDDAGSHPVRTVKISAELSLMGQMRLEGFLREYKDVFS